MAEPDLIVNIVYGPWAGLRMRIARLMVWLRLWNYRRAVEFVVESVTYGSRESRPPTIRAVAINGEKSDTAAPVRFDS